MKRLVGELNRATKRSAQKGVAIENHNYERDKLCELGEDAIDITQRQLTEIEIFLESNRGQCAQKKAPKTWTVLMRSFSDVRDHTRKLKRKYANLCGA